MAKFVDAITENTGTKVFKRVSDPAENPYDWELQPLAIDLLSERHGDGFYIIRAYDIQPNLSVTDCYMNVILPKRVSDFAFFIEGRILQQTYLYRYSSEGISAVAIDCFGIYDLYYSRTAPDIGIEVLKRGLALSERKAIIAEDLGYILRDEGRLQEAISMFELAAAEGPSSYFVYGELARLYSLLADDRNSRKYQALHDLAHSYGL